MLHTEVNNEMEELNDDLRKPREFLVVAEWCFDNRHYNSCANRAYYSMFRAAFAALRRLVSPKILPAESSHKGLISVFTFFLLFLLIKLFFLKEKFGYKRAY